jgi:hypothetical protein
MIPTVKIKELPVKSAKEFVADVVRAYITEHLFDVKAWATHFDEKRGHVQMVLFAKYEPPVRLDLVPLIQAVKPWLPLGTSTEAQLVKPGTLVMYRDTGAVIGRVVEIDEKAPGGALVHVDGKLERPAIVPGHLIAQAAREAPPAAIVPVAPKRHLVSAGVDLHFERAEDTHRQCNAQLMMAQEVVDNLNEQLRRSTDAIASLEADLAKSRNEHQETRARMADWLGDKDRELARFRELLGDHVRQNQDLERELARLKAKR